MYLLFESYPIVFEQGHGFNTGATGLTFLPIAVGGFIAVCMVCSNVLQLPEPRADLSSEHLLLQPKIRADTQASRAGASTTREEVRDGPTCRAALCDLVLLVRVSGITIDYAEPSLTWAQMDFVPYYLLLVPLDRWRPHGHVNLLALRECPSYLPREWQY